MSVCCAASIGGNATTRLSTSLAQYTTAALPFSMASPWVYCLVCNILPEDASTHLLGDEHRDLLAALCRYGQSSDCTTRRVYTSADGRLRAARVYLPSDVPVDEHFGDRL